MSTEVAAPREGEDVKVACGGVMQFRADTPWAIYRDAVVAFCTPACKREFEKDPEPFMAGKILHPVE